MKILENLKSFVKHRNYSPAESAYDLWAESYDLEKNNLMMHYDDIIFNQLISHILFKNKTIVDFGSGTGRHIPDIMLKQPADVICCDISNNMLSILKKKFPLLKAYLLKNNTLNFIDNKSIDILTTTLVIAHVEDLKILFKEWNRVLKEKAGIIITDFHPILLQNGGKRIFNHNGKKVAIRNQIHNIHKIKSLLNEFGFREKILIEKSITEDVRPFYENANAINVYNQFYGKPFIYGMALER